MTKKERQFLIGGSLCWLAFLILLWGVVKHQPWITTLDWRGYQLIQPTFPIKTMIISQVTKLGDPFNLQIITLLLMGLLWWRKRIADSLWFGAVNLVGYTLVIIVKYTIMRPRPTNRLVPIGGYSFPSGHTFATTVFVLTLGTLFWHLLRRQWERWLLFIILALVILVIMYSRVYLRVHYASDVCAGFLLACGWWLLVTAERHRCANWLLRPVRSFFL